VLKASPDFDPALESRALARFLRRIHLIYVSSLVSSSQRTACLRARLRRAVLEPRA
jgi:type II secretory pathway predicted ATPase ExeA